MSLDNIFKRRALRLKKELSEGNGPAPSFLSTIYPATDHEGAMPHTVKTPSSVPSSNDAEAVTTADDREMGQKEKDEPGPSKTTSASLRVVPGESAMVPPAHKKTAFELGHFGEDRTKQFIKNCVSIITGVKKLEQDDPHEGEDVDVEGANGHGHGDGHDHGPGTEECKCGGTCDECKSKSNGSNGNGGANGSGSGHDHSKLSDLARKFTKTKSSYG